MSSFGQVWVHSLHYIWYTVHFGSSQKWDSGVSVPPSPPLWPGPRWFPALGVSFKGDLLSGLVFIPGRFPGWVDTSLWIRLGGRVSIDGYLSFIQEWMCSYEHCSQFVSFQRNNVRATCRDHSCRECERKRWREYAERILGSTLNSSDVHM